MFLKESFGGEFINKVSDLGGQALSSLPMIPLPGGGGTSIGALGKVAQDKYREVKNSFSNSSQDTAIQNMLNKTFGLPVELQRSEYKPLEKHLNKIIGQSSSLSSNDFDEFFKLYDPIKKYYSEPNQKKLGISLSNMSGISNYFESFLRKASESNEIKSRYKGTSLGGWTKKDGKTQHTVDSYIQENFSNNKEFFQDIYEKLGGEKKKLTRGEDFWNKPFQRKE